MEKSASKINSYLCFKLGKELFATDVKNTIKILQLTDITDVPGSPDNMAGLINHHGNILPVYDLNQDMNFNKSNYDKNTCVIILNENEKNIGLIVNEVLSVESIKDEDIKPAPSIGENKKLTNIEGIFQKNENFVMVLDTKNILNSLLQDD